MWINADELCFVCGNNLGRCAYPFPVGKEEIIFPESPIYLRSCPCGGSIAPFVYPFEGEYGQCQPDYSKPHQPG